ncbi:ASCH domain-containing protein [Marinicellulosiphila megalodicopiae]|uniref:ASCH domain-containing protein n=1 Tax=Marinicellulosiphila megalodicopiae TaxID=2724896 RepID=UPI003BB2015A
MKLHLNLKGEYFHQIKCGEKKYEYRLFNNYWKKRLTHPVTFSEIVIKLGYPKSDDKEKIICRPWKGFEVTTITHPHFGDDPVQVFAIKVN